MPSSPPRSFDDYQAEKRQRFNTWRVMVATAFAVIILALVFSVVRIITVDTAGGTAVVLHRGVAHLIGIDADLGPGGTGAVMPLWSATTREADEALADVDDADLADLLTEWVREDRRAA